MDVYVVACAMYGETIIVDVFDDEQKAEASRVNHGYEEHEDEICSGVEIDDMDIYITTHSVR